MNNDYINNCLYDKKNDKYCPVFSIKSILNEAEPDHRKQLHMLENVIKFINLSFDFFFSVIKVNWTRKFF